MQTLRIKKKIDSEILYLPEFRNMIGRNVEIIIFAEPEKKSGEKDRMSKDVYNSVFSNENRQLLESINSVYADDMQDTEEQMIHTGMRRYHRHLITENGQW